MTAHLLHVTPALSILDECWEWNAARHEFGYGVKEIKGKTMLLHRVAWEWANGPIPDGLCVLHRCDNPPCVNPRHLFLGTKNDNIQDMINKGRGFSKTVCKRGHPLNSNSSVYHRPDGARVCVPCRILGKRMWRARRRAAGLPI